MSKRWGELHKSLDQIVHQLDQLERRTDKMETILMVREPSSSAAADAYEGLRKQVVTAVTERLAHLAQLVQLDTAMSAGASGESLGKLVSGWVEQASLARISNPAHPDQDLLFEMVEDLGGAVEVLEPAYVDTVTGRVIRRGQVRRSAVPELTAPPSLARHAARDPSQGADGGQAGDRNQDAGPDPRPVGDGQPAGAREGAK